MLVGLDRFAPPLLGLEVLAILDHDRVVEVPLQRRAIELVVLVAAALPERFELKRHGTLCHFSPVHQQSEL